MVNFEGKVRKEYVKKAKKPAKEVLLKKNEFYDFFTEQGRYFLASF
jgi:hypothetical protein